MILKNRYYVTSTLKDIYFQTTDTTNSTTQAVRLFPRGEYVSYSPKGKDSDQDFHYLNDDRYHIYDTPFNLNYDPSFNL
jgi:hypothetical protein